MSNPIRQSPPDKPRSESASQTRTVKGVRSSETQSVSPKSGAGTETTRGVRHRSNTTRN